MNPRQDEVLLKELEQNAPEIEAPVANEEGLGELFKDMTVTVVSEPKASCAPEKPTARPA